MSHEPMDKAMPLTAQLTKDELNNIAKLTPADQLFVKQQVLCPITMEPLGSMGIPLKVSIGNDLVFVCCAACKKSVLKEPEKILEQVHQWRAANQ